MALIIIFTFFVTRASFSSVRIQARTNHLQTDNWPLRVNEGSTKKNNTINKLQSNLNVIQTKNRRQEETTHDFCFDKTHFIVLFFSSNIHNFL